MKTLRTAINETFNDFSNECQNFTSAMSLKYRLLEYLLKQSNSISKQW